jgi:hypothetical protein
MDIAEDYYSYVYGEDWRQFYDYLKKISDLFDVRYFEQALSVNRNVSPYYNPEYAKSLEALDALLEEGRALIEAHYNSDYRVQTVSVRLLEYHLEFCKLLAETLKKKAVGNDNEAKELFNKFRVEFGKHEVEIERYYDHALYMGRYQRITCLDETKLQNAITEQ